MSLEIDLLSDFYFVELKIYVTLHLVRFLSKLSINADFAQLDIAKAFIGLFVMKRNLNPDPIILKPRSHSQCQNFKQSVASGKNYSRALRIKH